jgi:hypothetical protein
MPGVTIVQFTSGNYGALGSGDNLPVPFTSDNSLGNILLAWITSNDGGGITGTVTDSNSNTWELLPGINLTDEFSEFYVCTNCKGGANTVTANGCIPSSTGAPNLVLVEIQPPPCPIGSTGIQAFWGDHQDNFLLPSLNLVTNYSTNQVQWYHTLIVGLYNNTNNDSNTARTWTSTPDPNSIAGITILQFSEFSGNNTGVIAFSTVPYPYSQNSVAYTYSPSTPPLDNDENLVIGILFSTLS